MRTARVYRLHRIKATLLAKMPGLMISQRSRLRNQFGFLAGRLGMAYRWQIRSFRHDRRTLFQRFRPEPAALSRFHPGLTRWGISLTKAEMDMAQELDQSAQNMVNNTAQIEREVEQQLTPDLTLENSPDISETARQAFSRMDLLMEKWQLRALDLNRRMSGLNTLSPRQMMMAATLRQKAVTAFDARLGRSPIPASFTARQMAARSAVAPTVRPLSGSPRDLLQKKLKAMHNHTEQLAEDLSITRQNFDRRTATRSQHPQLAPKPKLLKPTTSRDKEDA